MLDTHAHWPSGIRDTTEFPKVDITIGNKCRYPRQTEREGE